ncbi:hypothetical protein E4U32_004362 [Claviceps aff. humidiphila group G2b]|nr:hypothetical protein E4U32_004362 [Claviceps aff. humidiphila group G2b]
MRQQTKGFEKVPKKWLCKTCQYPEATNFYVQVAVKIRSKCQRDATDLGLFVKLEVETGGKLSYKLQAQSNDAERSVRDEATRVYTRTHVKLDMPRPKNVSD